VRFAARNVAVTTSIRSGKLFSNTRRRTIRMPPQERKPKAKDAKARAKQALDLVLQKAKERRPDLQDEEVEVFSTSPTQGDGDWRAIVIVDGPERQIHLVGYNNETDQLYVEILGRAI
jgi:hypothetical protein